MPRKKKPPLLPHGVDDLEHGVNCLLDGFSPCDRQRLADKIASDLVGMGGDAMRDFIFATQRFAAHGGNGDDVRAAFHRFAVDNGPAIGRQQQASASARRSANARVSMNADRQARQIEWLARALQLLRPRALNVASAVTLLADKIVNDPAFAGIECPEDMPYGRTQLGRLIKRVPNLTALLRRKNRLRSASGPEI